MATPIHSDGTISIVVNGEHKRVAAGLTIARLADEMGLVPEKVAVERNLEVVPRSTLAEVCLEDGDEIEIVHFVGGGDHQIAGARADKDRWTVPVLVDAGRMAYRAGRMTKRLYANPSSPLAGLI